MTIKSKLNKKEFQKLLGRFGTRPFSRKTLTLTTFPHNFEGQDWSRHMYIVTIDIELSSSDRNLLALDFWGRNELGSFLDKLNSLKRSRSIGENHAGGGPTH